jgi:hypothetical protein
MLGKSQLLKDFVKNDYNLESILMRLKVILSDLKDDSILEWINGELSGFKKMSLPEYRILKGRAVGTFVVNQRVQYTNASVPLKGRLLKEDIEKLLTVEIKDSVNVLLNILQSENKDNVGISIPTEMCHSISDYNLQIVSMRIAISSSQLDGILATVKSKILDILLLLEKNFENIDDLDILSQIEENPNMAQEVIYNIQQAVFGDVIEIEIGDKNKIKNSAFGKLLGRKNEY